MRKVGWKPGLRLQRRKGRLPSYLIFLPLPKSLHDSVSIRGAEGRRSLATTFNGFPMQGHGGAGSRKAEGVLRSETRDHGGSSLGAGQKESRPEQPSVSRGRIIYPCPLKQSCARRASTAGTTHDRPRCKYARTVCASRSYPQTGDRRQ